MEKYGTWNSLFATKENGDLLGSIPAHGGDFFPESVFDYIHEIRTQVKKNIKGEEYHCNPVRVDIDITQVCNSKCTFCFSRPYQQIGYANQWTEYSILERTIKALAKLGTKTIRFCGGGDPLMHPNIKNLIPLPNKYGMKSCIITNGDYLNRELVDIVYNNVDHLRWSVNAASNETRIKIHKPNNRANLLSETFKNIKYLIQKRNDSGLKYRKPLIWATFLILPSNFEEIEEATYKLKEVGVDSVSFRPVYHGLGGKWTSKKLERAWESLAKIKSYQIPSKFYVFTPKRLLEEADSLNPNDHFDFCRSRRLRTVLEATSEGLSLQSCGIYRGTGSKAGLVIQSNNFDNVWNNFNNNPVPFCAPNDCNKCIDVSINLTLNFIFNVLKEYPKAKFTLHNV